MANVQIVVATRLHLGKASAPPPAEKLRDTLKGFVSVGQDLPGVCHVVAVDCTPKIEGYDYVREVKEIIDHLKIACHVLPVTPWGKFVPALNALVHYAHDMESRCILFISAEVRVSNDSLKLFLDEMDDDTLVVGAAMNGHMHVPGEEVNLTGRSCPWNTLAMWSVPKLALCGFQLVSDLGDNAGVEECVTVAIHQKIFPSSRAKLLKLSDVQWQETFDDEERQRWHEQKMKSKLQRAEKQLQLLSLNGRVVHI